MKKIGFLNFGHWTDSPQSAVRSASDALLQSIDLAVAAEELGADGAYFRVHHFARQLASPFPLLAAVGARTSRIEIGTGVIDMRYENPLYMAEDAGSADLISGGRLQLGISRGSPEQVIDGWRYFGYAPAEGEDQADMARRHTEVFLQVLEGEGFAQPNPRPMFPNPPGLLRPEPHSPGLRNRIWWGAASDTLLQSIDLSVAAEELGADGAYFRVHHFARQLASPFPLLAAIGARTSRIEIGTGVIDMRYENPLYMAEDAGSADLISGGRLQLGISRGSPEQVIDGWRYFGYAPAEGEDQADMARRHTEVFLQVLEGEGFAQPNPRPMFPNPPGLLRPEPHSPGLRNRIWWGAASDATARWTAEKGMHLMSSTLKADETGEPFHLQQRKQIEVFRDAWRQAGHEGEPRVSVSRSIMPITTDLDRMYFGHEGSSSDQFGQIEANLRAVFGKTYAAEPDVLVKELADDEAIAAADTLLLTVPNQLGVDYNAHILESVLTDVAPDLGWR
jgi:alkanesulfonate monooxygenase SsuD/methylene tetrahydromethanopterin reductase-like flavin-dependent oxidoreductase (luciferase family)